jgi:hypothetical protein
MYDDSCSDTIWRYLSGFCSDTISRYWSGGFLGMHLQWWVRMAWQMTTRRNVDVFDIPLSLSTAIREGSPSLVFSSFVRIQRTVFGTRWHGCYTTPSR